MNTHVTTHPPSPIEVLSEVLRYHQESKYVTDEDILESIVDIWLPVFRSDQNFALALRTLKISYAGEVTAVLCDRYLAAIEVIT